jgi:putative peptidoglycan lipid II flippase
MAEKPPPSIFAGLRITSLATLASRLLGMLRDMAIAALLGVGGTMDAFSLAFRIPNLFRRLLGEGALAASYLPVLTAHLERDRRAAWQLASVLLTQLAVLLTALLLIVELICWWFHADTNASPNIRLLAGLSAVMMPFMVLICLTAQLSATLNSLHHFALPALVPIILNITLLVGATILAPYLAVDQAGQAYVLAGCVLLAGVIQLLALLPAMYKAGFRFEYNIAAARDGIRDVIRAFIPMLFGLAVTQLNTLADSIIAWAFAAPPVLDKVSTAAAAAANELPRITWLWGEPVYPMAAGAVSTIYYGERLYQFPLGMLGVAVATVIFPLFSRHAARGDRAQLGADLGLALRLVALWGLPASAGLYLLAEPISALLFQRGEFTMHDTLRTAAVIANYGLGVWAFCATPVLVRGYYAVGKQTLPVMIAAAMCVANMVLNLVLIWPLAEAGLALATSITATIQVVWLVLLAPKHLGPLPWRALFRTLVVSLVATVAMFAASFTMLATLTVGKYGSTPTPLPMDTLSRLSYVAWPMLVAAGAYLFAIRCMPGNKEHFRLLMGKAGEE